MSLAKHTLLRPASWGVLGRLVRSRRQDGRGTGRLLLLALSGLGKVSLFSFLSVRESGIAEEGRSPTEDNEEENISRGSSILQLNLCSCRPRPEAPTGRNPAKIRQFGLRQRRPPSEGVTRSRTRESSAVFSPVAAVCVPSVRRQ